MLGTRKKSFFELFSDGIMHSIIFEIEVRQGLKAYWSENTVKYLSDNMEKGMKSVKSMVELECRETQKAIRRGDYEIEAVIEDIERELDMCKDNKERERYIYSCLRPFKETWDWIYPVKNIREGRMVLGILDKVKEGRVDTNENQEEMLKFLFGKEHPTSNEIDELMERVRDRINTHIVIRRVLETLCNAEYQPELSEWMAAELYNMLKGYALQLDAMLLRRGIDLLWYQDTYGIYLFEERDMEGLSKILGGYDAAERLIEIAQPKSKEESAANGTVETAQQGEQDKKSQKKAFKDSMILDKEGLRLKALHDVMTVTEGNTRKGKEAALVIRAAVELGWMQKQSYTKTKDEFGDIGAKSGFDRYMAVKGYGNDINRFKEVLNTRYKELMKQAEQETLMVINGQKEIDH